MATRIDRDLVRRMDGDTTRLVRLGLPEARRICGRIERRVVSSYGRSEDYGSILTIEFEAMAALLTQAMIVGRLVGIKRARLLYPVDMARSPYRQILAGIAYLWGDDPLAARHVEEFSAAESALIIAQTVRALRQRLDGAAMTVAAQGLHVRDGRRLFREAFDTAGLSPRNSYTAENLLRTQTQMAYSAGRWNADQDPAIQRRLWGYTYATAGDERVRLNHAALDGLTLPKDDSQWQEIWPPNGYSCRCQAIPVFDEREIVRPGPTVIIDGTEVVPGADRGWAFHPGRMGRTGMAA